jgi:beta-hydroxylase
MILHVLTFGIIGFIIIIGLILMYLIKHIFILKNLFLSIDNYPQIKKIQDNWIIFRNEMPKFDINTITFKRENDAEWFENGGISVFDKLKNNDNWIRWDYKGYMYTFPLIYKNNIVGKAGEICPKTTSILKSLNNINIACYSLLLPNSFIDYHTDLTGPNYNSMALNMKLIGDNCDLKIKKFNKTYVHNHESGKAVIFNSELPHSAQNYSDSIRIILYVDFIC